MHVIMVLDHVTGDYILFVDSDDFIVNTMCERLFTIANSTHADMVSCNYYIYRGDDDISIHTMSVQDDKRTFYRHGYVEILSAKNGTIRSQCCME